MPISSGEQRVPEDIGLSFPNARKILKMGSPLSSVKLMMAAATTTRPNLRGLFTAMLQPFVHDGAISIQYPCYERSYESNLRMSDLTADFLSTKELCLEDVYHLERDFKPDLIVDGGGNIGLFTLRAAAAMRRVDGSAPKIVVCEPLPRNVDQIKKHLAMNKVDADVLPVCLGGRESKIPFYCRGANQSSFDSAEAYDSVIEMPVVTLWDVVASHPAERILIKLDIEGMEIEVLEAYVPSEQRAVYIVGELHDLPKNLAKIEGVFRDHGWLFELMDADIETSGFRACSPAAVPLLEWARILKSAMREQVQGAA